MGKGAVTLICGDDDYLVTREGRQCYEALAATVQDEFSREVISGACQNLEEMDQALSRFRAAVQTLSMFGDKKVVWLRDVNFLGDTVVGRSEGAKQRISDLQELLVSLDPSGVEVVITAFPVDRRRKEFKWFQENCKFKDIKTSGEDGVAGQLAEEEAATLGVRFEPGALNLLVGKVQGNTRLIIEEVRKLAAYLGKDGGGISTRLVDELVPVFGESDFFEPTEAFFSLNLPWTLDALRRYFFTNTSASARPLISSLQQRNRLLIQLQVLMDAGELTLGSSGFSKAAFETAAAKYARHFGGLEEKSAFNVFTQNLWYLGNRVAVRHGEYSLKRLVDWQLEFQAAFERLLLKDQDEYEVMRDLVIKCLA